mmetsp:Transcript_12582/g.25147  ORF Transcript_12582/g.25147 Transcript_12582/m.25147 type:complete len:449 (+) Transcript_12582:223-1569(+)
MQRQGSLHLIQDGLHRLRDPLHPIRDNVRAVGLVQKDGPRRRMFHHGKCAASVAVVPFEGDGERRPAHRLGTVAGRCHLGRKTAQHRSARGGVHVPEGIPDEGELGDLNFVIVLRSGNCRQYRGQKWCLRQRLDLRRVEEVRVQVPHHRHELLDLSRQERLLAPPLFLVFFFFRRDPLLVGTFLPLVPLPVQLLTLPAAVRLPLAAGAQGKLSRLSLLFPAVRTGTATQALLFDVAGEFPLGQFHLAQPRARVPGLLLTVRYRREAKVIVSISARHPTFVLPQHVLDVGHDQFWHVALQLDPICQRHDTPGRPERRPEPQRIFQFGHRRGAGFLAAQGHVGTREEIHGTQPLRVWHGRLVLPAAADPPLLRAEHREGALRAPGREDVHRLPQHPFELCVGLGPLVAGGKIGAHRTVHQSQLQERVCLDHGIVFEAGEDLFSQRQCLFL